MNSEQLKHYGDLAALGSGGISSAAFWTEMASSATIWITLVGALLSTIWIGWRCLDRWRYGPAHTRGGDDG